MGPPTATTANDDQTRRTSNRPRRPPQRYQTDTYPPAPATAVAAPQLAPPTSVAAPPNSPKDADHYAPATAVEAITPNPTTAPDPNTVERSPLASPPSSPHLVALSTTQHNMTTPLQGISPTEQTDNITTAIAKPEGQLPKLNAQGTNFQLWQLSLDDYADANGLSYLLEATHQPPISTSTEYTQYRKHRGILRLQILRSLPDGFEHHLEINRETTPYQLVQDIATVLQSQTTLDHHILRQEAETTFFTEDLTLEQYISKHLEMRSRQKNAKYPNILEEQTTVEFIMQGLRAHPQYKQLPAEWIRTGTVPKTVKDTELRLKSVQAHLSAAEHATPPPPQPTPAGAPSQAPPPHNRERGGRRGRPYRDREPYSRDRKYRDYRRNQPPRNTQPQIIYVPQPYPQYTPPNLQHQQMPPYPGTQPVPVQIQPLQPRPQSRNPRNRNVAFMGATEYIEPEAPGSPYGQPHDNEDTGKSYALDSGAHPTHVNTPTPTMTKLKNPPPTHTATDTKVTATHSGPIQIPTMPGTNIKIPAIASPHIKTNLVSVHDVARACGQVTFMPNQAYLVNTVHKHLPTIVGTATFKNGLYYLNRTNTKTNPDIKTLSARTIPRNHNRTPRNRPPNTQTKTQRPPHSQSPPPQNPKKNTTKIQVTAPTVRHPQAPKIYQIPNPAPSPKSQQPHTTTHADYHLIFNHSAPRKLQQMATRQLIPLPPDLKRPPPHITCSGCAAGKCRTSPHKRKQHQYQVGAALSSDICGPVSPQSRQGNKYIITIIDTQSRYLIVDFLPNRRQLATRLDRLFQLITTMYCYQPTIFHTDNAKEYLAKECQPIYAKYNLHHQTCLPYSPQENGIAERINATLFTATRCTLKHSNLPRTHWEDAIRDAVYKYNITIHKTTNQLPYTIWHRKQPKATKLLAFGQLGTIPELTDKTTVTKLQSRAQTARYLYAQDDEHIMVQNLDKGAYHLIRTADFKPYHRATDPVNNTTAAFKARTTHPDPQQITATTPAPKTPAQARRYPDAHLWEQAHNDELDKIDTQGIIEWIPDQEVPRKTKLVPLTIGYRYKRNTEGHITQRKARCNLRGDRMVPGDHYDPTKTTSYMADKTAVRLLLAIAATFNLHIEHLDIESAYLHEPYKHDKPVYVRQFPRFNGTFKHACKAGKLKGNLYGGKNSGNTYLTAAFEYLRSIKLTQSQAEPCLFYSHKSNGSIIISISMDDFLVAATDVSLINNLCQNLSKKYKIKRLGTPKQYLGWKIDRQQNGAIHISQPDYIDRLLHKMRMRDCNSKDSPYVDGAKYHAPTPEDKHTPERRKMYETILGDLRYITDSTRPYIYYLVNRVATALQQPTARHWCHLKQLLRYLKHTKHTGIHYPNKCNKKHQQLPTLDNLKTYADADFARDAKDRKSLTGVVHLYNGAPIAWTSAKQRIQALSTCEAEYIAATTAVQQTQWLRRILNELQLLPKAPTTLHIDNQSAVLIANNAGPTKRRKYIDLRHHYLSQYVHDKTIKVTHVPSHSMLADIFTKPTKRPQYHTILNQLGIRTRNKQEPQH